MKTEISKKFGRIQTLAVIFTLSFTGIPVSPVWAGSSTKIEKIAGPALAEKSATPTDNTTTLRAPAFVGRADLGDSTAPPGPLSLTTTVKAPSNNVNLRGVAPVSAQETPGIFTLKWQPEYHTAAKHLEFLKQAFTMGSSSSDRTSFPFYDGAGNLAATVYYNGAKVKQIVYAADPVNLIYPFDTHGHLADYSRVTMYDRLLGPPLDPKVISQDGASLKIVEGGSSLNLGIKQANKF